MRLPAFPTPLFAAKHGLACWTAGPGTSHDGLLQDGPCAAALELVVLPRRSEIPSPPTGERAGCGGFHKVTRCGTMI